MNVIVSNRQKEVLDNANIDAIKDLNGLFNVSDLINNFKNYFFSKMIIDATSIVNFTNQEVLKELVDGIGAEKLIILLPEKPKAPKKFLAILVNLGIYNFTSNIDDVVKFLQKPNTYDDVKVIIDDTHFTYNDDNDTSTNSTGNFINVSNTNGAYINSNLNTKYVLGIKNVTVNAGSTSLIYMLKKILETKFGKSVLAVEINTNDFIYYRNNKMISVESDKIENLIKNSNDDIILVDLSNSNYDSICNEVLYLIEPSIIKVNKLMASDRKVFSNLSNKKIVLNKSLLSDNDISIFAHEAGVTFFFVIPPLNDRIVNEVLEQLINKLNISNNSSNKTSFLGFFNKNS